MASERESVKGYDTLTEGSTPVVQEGPEKEAQLLRQLEELNRYLETNSKALTKIPVEAEKPRVNTPKMSVRKAAKTPDEALPMPTSEEGLCHVWSQMAVDWEANCKKKWKQIRELAWRGVPNPMRTLVWPLLAGVRSTEDSLKTRYPQLLASVSPFEKQIQRDLTRTFPEHDFFRNGPGQEALQNVLKAYSVYDREVGYCQGSPFIAGVLLLHLPEEDAFSVFVKIMETHKLREVFKPNMSEVAVYFYQLEKLIEETYPDLCKHFQSVGFSTSMYASSWFVTLFASTLSLNVVYRIMDAFLVDGLPVVFRVGLALLHCSCSDLLQMDIEAMLKHCQQGMKDKHEEDPRHLLETAWGIKWDNYSKKVKKWGQDYHARKEKLQAENQELQRLRADNTSLQGRVSELEKECAALADKLIRGQVNRAQEAESMYILQKEVRLLRRFSKKVLDEPMGGSGSPESEAGSQTEGTPGGHRQQWHLSSMSREDSEEEENEVSSEDIIAHLSGIGSDSVCSPVKNGLPVSPVRVVDLERQLAAQKIEGEEAAEELERKRQELIEAGLREEGLRQQLTHAQMKIANLEEHLTKAKELLRVLLSSTATEEGPTDSKGGSPSHPHSQPLQRKQVHNTASAVPGRTPLPDGTSCSESSESTMASDTESDASSAHTAAAKVHHSRPRPTSIEANSN